MHSFKQLVFISQSVEREQALFQWLLNFTKQHDASLLVLTVLPEVGYGLVNWVKNVLPADIMESEVKREYDARRAWIAQAEALGLSITVQVEFGKLFYTATQVAQRINADMMVKQTEEETKGLKDHIFGTQDMSLLRVCPCPLLLHKYGTRLPFGRVMASIDVDIEMTNLEPNDLNQKILAWANDFASPQEASLHVVHAWFAGAENLVRYWNTDITDVEIMQFTQKVQKQHADAVEQELKSIRATVPDLKVYLPKGHPEDVVPGVIVAQEVDLLVMGALGRTGLPGIVIGNTAETILGTVGCSVVAIKPNGFVSPVKI